MVTQPESASGDCFKKRIAPLLEKIDNNALKSTVYMLKLNNIKTVSAAFKNANVLSISVLRITVVLVALLVYNLWAG
jgi:hypothetical protein